MPLVALLSFLLAAPLPIRLAKLRGRLPGGWALAPVQAVEPGATALAWAGSHGRYLQLDY